MKLRPYQKQDYKLLKKQLKKDNHVLFGASVGFGKSVIIYKLVKDALKKNKRIMILLPRRKLVKQIAETLAEFDPSLIMGTDTNYWEGANVYVCSIQTLNARIKKHGKKYLGDLDIVCQDEAHLHHLTTSTEAIRKVYWDKVKWVGLSATPIDNRAYRLEGYEHTIYEHQMQDLIEMGWLTPVKVMVEEVPKGLDDIHMVGGDYNEGELASLMSEDAHVNNVFSVWKKYAKNRNTMIFAVNIAHAELIYQDFVKHGIPVGIVHSNQSETVDDAHVEAFAMGAINVLVNVTKLNTGFDMPRIDCIIKARPTKSLTMDIQSSGRGIRLYKGKKDCLILDVAGTVAQHGYPTMKRDFNRTRPPQGATEPLEFKDIECPHCGYTTQPRNCKRETITTKLHITKRTICLACNEIINETVVDTKTIDRMKLVNDYTNTGKVTDNDVGDFVRLLAKERDYNPMWISFIAKDYNNNKEFNEFMKLLVNKYKAEMIKVDTAINNIAKFRKDIGLY